MASPITRNKKLLLLSQKFVAEMLGTYMLVFVGCGSAYIGKRGSITLEGAALAWAAVVAAIVYSIGHISGSHINPACSIALATVGLFPWKQVPMYVVAQFMGSIFASVTLRLLFGADEASTMLTLPVGPNPASDLNVVIWEIIITFILLLVICCTAVDPRSVKGLGGVAIGAAVYFNVILTGGITASSMNPARSIGPALINHNFKKLWIYIIAPIIGALCGTSLYHFLQLSSEIDDKTMQIAVLPSPGIDHDDPAYRERTMEYP